MSNKPSLTIGAVISLVGIVLLLIFSFLVINSQSILARTPANNGVPKPDGFLLYLPWRSGDTGKLGGNAYNEDQHTGTEFYALDFNVKLDATDLNAKGADIFPAASGEVIFAGLGPSTYGYTVVLKHSINDGFDYYSQYSHLYSISTGIQVSTAVTLETQLGIEGGTGTGGSAKWKTHLHFALRRCDQNSIRAGSVLSDLNDTSKCQAVVPEPIVGNQIYEGLAWIDQLNVSVPITLTSWRPSTTDATSPTGNWGNQTAAPASTLEADASLVFDIQYSDVGTSVGEIRATAYYTDWAGSQSNLIEFDSQAVWRIIARCRPQEANAQCDQSHWLLTWPLQRDTGRALKDLPGLLPVPWLPKARPIAPSNGVRPVCISFDVFDRAGNPYYAPGGVMCEGGIGGIDVAPGHEAIPINLTEDQARLIYIRAPINNSNDQASFIIDVTLPDDTIVSPGQSLVKTWRLRNTGTTAWGNGYQLVFVNGEQMNAPSPVSISATAPNSTADVSINFTAPSSPGDHIGYWRLRNPQGTYFGPTIWVKISIQSPSGYLTLFTADPSSPANASQVRIHARATGMPNLRALRLKIDGNVVYEIGAPEFYFNWNTSGYASGAHNLVLEAADQTDTSWSHPQRRSMAYTLLGTSGSNNHAPNRPNPNSPYDWYVYYSGNTAQLCAQANGDPDGDPLTYYFDIYQGAQTWNSGWTTSSCVTTSALGPYDYQWRVKVRDNYNAESEWSETWHFTLVNPSLSISELYFQPQDANSEQVKIRTCTTGQGGIGITMRVSVNDASDGSGNGTWHIIKEQGSPCFNDVDAPIWNTLEYGDGPHRVRSEAHGLQTGWNGAAVREEVYTLPHRRPGGTRLLAPVPLSGNIREAIYLNTRTVSFQWQPTLRASSYTLHIGTNPSPKDDPNPIIRQTLGSSSTGTTVTFDQDFPTLFWQISTSDDVGSNASGDQLFGIDRTAPACSVQPLAPISYENVFQVTWSGTDNLSGIHTFDLQYLDSGRGVWSDWLTAPLTKTYELFTGQPGHTYSFHCQATDQANNPGLYPVGADTSTRIDPSARPPAPWWNPAYSEKRNLTILNNMAAVALPAGYPVHIHFDAGTNPTAAEIYNASQTSTKCDDVRVVYNDATELNRLVFSCTPSAVDIWFRTQISLSGGTSNNTSHQLYYGNVNAGSPPADASQVWYPYRESDTSNLYLFQEGSGTTSYDYSGNGRNCTINPTVQWAASKWGNGLHFSRANNGDTVSLTCGSPYPLSAFTVEFWYKPDQDTDGRITGQLGPSGQLSWLFSIESDRMKFERWCNGCGGQARGNINFRNQPYYSQWNYLALTYDGSRVVKFYVNGNLDNAVTLDGSGLGTYNIPLEIGSVEGMGQGKYYIGAYRLSKSVKTSFDAGAFAMITTEPSTAAGSSITPPATGSPNLAILDLSTQPAQAGGLIAQAVIRNDGTRGTENGFYTDLYLNHLPIGVGDYTGSLRFWVNDPIAAGSIVTLTTVITDLASLGGLAMRPLAPLSENTGTLYAQVDSTGAVSETNNVDNIYSASAEACVATADAYEGDDSVAMASLIALSQIQQHNFSGPGDRDWVSFTAQSGMTYTLRTLNPGPAADTYLYLYDVDSTTLLASNDDAGGSLASQIDWTAPITGTYYVLAQHWNPNVGGCGTTYDLSVTRALTNKVYLPLVRR